MASQLLRWLGRFRRSRWPFGLCTAYGLWLIGDGVVEVSRTGMDWIDTSALTGVIVVLVFGSRFLFMTVRQARRKG